LGEWEGERATLLRAAAAAWIPIEDLREFLNRMPGPQLTRADVEQRLRAFYEEPYMSYPDEELRAGCLELYAKERDAGTEMPAIIGALQAHVEREEARLRFEFQGRYRRQQEDARLALEQRFLSGADCKWTPLQGSKELFCRVNGRSYRLSPTADKKWKLHRISSPVAKGILIGTYGYRRDATKSLDQIAYRPEPHM